VATRARLVNEYEAIGEEVDRAAANLVSGLARLKVLGDELSRLTSFTPIRGRHWELIMERSLRAALRPLLPHDIALVPPSERRAIAQITAGHAENVELLARAALGAEEEQLNAA